MPEPARAQLIHIDVDRRLGHEWDEWDGKPLPNQGNYDSSPVLFFVLVGRGARGGTGGRGPRPLPAGSPSRRAPDARFRPCSGPRSAPPPSSSGLWWGVLFLSYAAKRPLLPERLAERGPFLRLMRLTSRVADRFGRRDWVENASVKVYNALALLRGRKVGKGELLLLIPRCLSKETLDGVLGIAGKYGVPVFVATRGQLARRVIRERRPRAVVAVACERDMVSGLHDVAGKIPGARTHDDSPIGAVQGRAAQPAAAGGVGPGVRDCEIAATERRTGSRPSSLLPVSRHGIALRPSWGASRSRSALRLVRGASSSVSSGGAGSLSSAGG